MNPGQVLGVLCCLGFIGCVIIAFEITVFRMACALCKVPQPGPFKTIGMVLILLAVPAVMDGIISGILYEIYMNAGYPLWEAGIVQFFLALPIHMFICSLIHAQLMSIPLGQSLAVWLVEKLLKLILVAVAAGVVALFLLARQAK